jgi:hypothetical protein
MFRRMKLIYDVGGIWPAISTWVVLLGAIAFPVAEWLLFRSVFCLMVVIGVTFLGWLMRRRIMEIGPVYSIYSTRILFAYGVVLFLTKRLGFGHHAQLVVITLATVLMFNLNFWTVSEAAIADQEIENDPS